jgi:lantibiotic modifying enzyme
VEVGIYPDVHRVILYADYLEEAAESLCRKFQQYPQQYRPIDIDRAIASILLSLSQQCDQALLPVVSYEIFNYVEENNLRMQTCSGETERYSYHSFFMNGDNGKPIFSKIRNEYAFLLSRIANMTRQMTFQICLALDRFLVDISSIENFFRIDIGHVQSIELAGDDRHNNSSQVVYVHVDTGHTIVYKPSSLRTDNALHDFVSLCMGESLFMTRTVKSLDRGRYGWAEYVQFQQLTSQEECREYWSKAGALLAVMDMCDFCDGHFENVVATRTGPCIIDCETIFQYARLVFDNPLEEYSVLATGLIQKIGDEEHGRGALAAFQVAGNYVNESIYPHPINERTLDLRVSMSGARASSLKNYPVMSNQFVPLTDYRSQFIEGMEIAYQCIDHNKSRILSNSYWSIYKGLKIRQLLRDTIYYGLIERLSEQPRYARSKEKTLKLFGDKLFPNKEILQGLPGMSQVVHYEISSLSKMDIPIFYTHVDGCDLWDGDGNRYEHFIKEPAFKQVQRRIADLDEKYISRQVEIVSRHMDLGLMLGEIPDSLVL